jgi:hypothetical protein
LAVVVTGDQHPTGGGATELLDALAGAARRAGCAAELAAARDGLSANGSSRQREVAAQGGSLTALTRWLADRFLG